MKNPYLTLLFLFALFSAQASWASPANTQANCKALTATGNPEYPPYLFRDKEDSTKLAGANAEILKLLGEYLGLEINIKHTGPWARAQKLVSKGQIDLIAGAFFTVPRAQYMDYVYPAFLNTESVVWSNKAKPIKYTSNKDLINLHGTTVIHNSFGEEFDKFAKSNLDIKTVSSLKQAFSILQLGRVDYLLYEKLPGRAYASHWGFSDQTVISEKPISTESLYLTISHLSKCNTGSLRGKITEALHHFSKSGLFEDALNTGMKLWEAQKQVQ